MTNTKYKEGLISSYVIEKCNTTCKLKFNKKQAKICKHVKTAILQKPLDSVGNR